MWILWCGYLWSKMMYAFKTYIFREFCTAARRSRGLGAWFVWVGDLDDPLTRERHGDFQDSTNGTIIKSLATIHTSKADEQGSLPRSAK